MHIIIDWALTMYSLQADCNSILAQKGQPRVLKTSIYTNTWFFTLYLLTPRQCDDIGGGVLTLGKKY